MFHCRSGNARLHERAPGALPLQEHLHERASLRAPFGPTAFVVPQYGPNPMTRYKTNTDVNFPFDKNYLPQQRRIAAELRPTQLAAWVAQQVQPKRLLVAACLTAPPLRCKADVLTSTLSNVSNADIEASCQTSTLSVSLNADDRASCQMNFFRRSIGGLQCLQPLPAGLGIFRG